MTSTATSTVCGVLELPPKKNAGHLRDPKRGFRPGPTDCLVPERLVQRYRLREGLTVEGPVETGRKGGQRQLRDVTSINGQDPAALSELRPFEDGVVIDPAEALTFETAADVYLTRVIDLITPIGKGQRGLIVAPPRSGKTVMLEQMALAIQQNHPDCILIVMLVDERPEEVTHFRTATKAMVLASSNDQDTDQHVRVSRMGVAMAKRLVEYGKDVVVLLDSLTRLGRAFNKTVNSGRVMSGGVDINALQEPKRMFGAARNIEGGGSLTILATCLIDTGSRMDELIFQEFKGTGNMEIILDRDMADRRVYPAIDVPRSGTRKEELLFPADQLKQRFALRRVLTDMKPIPAMEGLLKLLERHPTNSELLAFLSSGRASV
ncbi:MAG: transcription termination factor Rho [Trichloromonas sp.]|jgi:transcription termination factor Rho|nr:transcription termination factor Rho [Trichloromonas sp.]